MYFPVLLLHILPHIFVLILYFVLNSSTFYSDPYLTGIFTFWGEKCPYIQIKRLFCTRNTPRIPREKNDFVKESKGEQTIITFW